MQTVIEVRELNKSFNGQAVISNANLQINKGEIYGFLGPNGSGKTTIMKILLNLVKPTTGIVKVFGETLKEDDYTYLKRIGSMIEYPIFFDKMTAAENLAIHCEYVGFYDKQVIQETLEIVGLADVGDKRVTEFSLGMKQRLGIARAIITKPELLILDEPINGLDPIGIKEIRELILKLSHEYGITVLISSHIVSEIEQIADTIGVINHGKVLKEVRLSEIKAEMTAYLELSVDQAEKASYILAEKLGLKNFKVLDGQTIRIYEQTHAQSEINQVLVLNQILVEKMEAKQNTLEDYFLNMINGSGK
ncbi:ABC transporter ATP-binding protein [Isobaculum melis]|uniref:ABC-2 type transport system ATP-binding protein n=1 Tax=Isobaculum melis TaxID=142588 RepID=A0A1H9SQE0_9LACT|nr:ABC transporter ATP-binding protein [Isobaculum melis]SER87015.1 ABC-2 type transport system ATP-binding protein [Isobaculum melis]